MFDTSTSRHQLILKQLIPLGCILLAVILDRGSVLGFLPVQPLLSLPTIYYWSLYRPDWISLVGLMGIGIIDDSLGGTYLGQNTVLFFVIYGTVLKQMDYFMTAGFMHTWMAFFIIMGMCSGIQWLFTSLLYNEPVSIVVLLIQNACTTFAFPVVYYLFNRTVASYTYDWE